MIARADYLRFIVAAGRQEHHAVRFWNERGGAWGYKPASGAISDQALRDHLNGGPHLGIYFFAPDSKTVLLGGFDLDDHDGAVEWSVMADIGRRLCATAKHFGINLGPARSGGGRGIHLFGRWDKAQDAAAVRHALLTVLEAEGLEEGTKGVAAGQIEVYPKQPAVIGDELGSLLALPFARQSVPLNADMQPIDSPMMIITSAPVAAAPPEPEKKPGRKRAVDPDQLREALSFLPADQFPDWVNFGLAIKDSLGDDGFSIWDEWSRTAEDKYPGAPAAERQWRSFKPRGRITIGSVFHRAKEAGWSGPQRKRPAALVLADILEKAELWSDERRVGYATVTVDHHKENLAINGTELRLWLSDQFWQQQKKPPTPEALRQTIDRAAGIALFGRKATHRTWVRVAADGDRLFLDLGDPAWRAIEIDANGWRVIDDVPVRFVRQGSTRPLPLPEPGGKIDDLRRFICIADDDSFVLIVGWAIACMRPGLPLSILFLSGEQGSAKTSSLRALTLLLDPRVIPVAAPAKDEGDLIVAAQSRWLVTGDNLSYLNADMADSFCRLATGGGLEKRRLYTDDDVVSISVLRPVAMTGINIPTNRADFLDRCVSVTLVAPGGEDQPRLDEETLNAEFEVARPRLLGALLDGVSTALRRRDDTRARLLADGTLPRMADFAIFAEAAGVAFGWEDGAFICAHSAMLETLMEDAAEGDSLVLSIREWLRSCGKFSGSATDLYAALTKFKFGTGAQELPKYWPANPTRLGRDLTARKPKLAALGIQHEKDEKGHRATHHLTLSEGAGAQAQGGLPIGEDEEEVPF